MLWRSASNRLTSAPAWTTSGGQQDGSFLQLGTRKAQALSQPHVGTTTSPFSTVSGMPFNLYSESPYFKNINIISYWEAGKTSKINT